MFAVFLEDDSTVVAGGWSRRRPRGEALFHLAGDPVVLAELLAGDRAQDRAGFRRKGQADRQPQARARAGYARLTRSSRWRKPRLALVRGSSPELVYQALPFAIDPEWTRGSQLYGRAADRRARAAGPGTSPSATGNRCGSSSANSGTRSRRDGDDVTRRVRPAAARTSRGRSAIARRSAATARPSRRSSAGRTSPAAADARKWSVSR